MSKAETIETNQFSTPADYFSLLKPRVMSLVIFTGACGIFLAPGEIHPFIALITILSIAIGSGASGAINMWYDRDIDQVMKRTQKRPIPAGKIHPDEALGFGAVLSVISVVLLAVTTNYVAAGVLAFAIFFYVYIYTIWLKRSTPQNIVIGGAAGSFPPMIGWAAVTGDITIMPIALFLIIFFWTPPHFWALSLLIKDEYKDAKVPMLPVVAGEESTRKQILVYTIILAGISALPIIFELSSLIYYGIWLVFNAAFLLLSLKLYRDKSNSTARKTFLFSILYLFVLFLALVIDKLLLY